MNTIISKLLAKIGLQSNKKEIEKTPEKIKPIDHNIQKAAIVG